MNSVTILAVRKNHAEFGGLKQFAVESTSARVDGMFWRLPVVNVLGFVTGYSYDTADAKPSADALRVMRISDSKTADVYMAAVPDSATPADFEAARNSTTQAASVLPANAIPDVIVEVFGKPNGSNFEHFVFTDVLFGNEKYFLRQVTVDGVVLTAPPATGFDTLAALVTWFNANNASAGTLSNPVGTRLLLVNSTKKKVSLDVYKARFWDSAALPALSSQVYQVAITDDGVVTTYKATTGATNAATLLAELAKSPLAAFGKFSSPSSNLRLASTWVDGTVTVAVTAVAP